MTGNVTDQPVHTKTSSATPTKSDGLIGDAVIRGGSTPASGKGTHKPTKIVDRFGNTPSTSTTSTTGMGTHSGYTSGDTWNTTTPTSTTGMGTHSGYTSADTWNTPPMTNQPVTTDVPSYQGGTTVIETSAPATVSIGAPAQVIGGYSAPVRPELPEPEEDYNDDEEEDLDLDNMPTGDVDVGPEIPGIDLDDEDEDDSDLIPNTPPGDVELEDIPGIEIDDDTDLIPNQPQQGNADIGADPD